MMSISIRGAALLLLATAACDTTVTNPGPVREFLPTTVRSRAMVNSAGRAVSSGMNWISYTGAAIAWEVHPAGSTGSFGISARWQNGELNGDDGDLNTHWETAQRARWLAEETLRRLESAGPPPTGSLQTPVQYANALMQAYVYAGYADRLLGENMCEAVIDGSGALPNATFFTRAESLFTKALAVTGGTPATVTTLSNAAYAGRAAARAFPGKWTEAVTGWAGGDRLRLQHAVLQHRQRRPAEPHLLGVRQHARERLGLSSPHAVEHLVLRLPRGDERSARPDHGHHAAG
jgi:hypothetical protein